MRRKPERNDESRSGLADRAETRRAQPLGVIFPHRTRAGDRARSADVRPPATERVAEITQLPGFVGGHRPRGRQPRAHVERPSTEMRRLQFPAAVAVGAGPVARLPEAAVVRRVKRAAVEVNSAAASHAVDVALDGAVAPHDTVGAHADRPGRRTAPGDRGVQRERLLLPQHDHERGPTSAAHQTRSAGGQVCGYDVARRLDRVHSLEPSGATPRSRAGARVTRTGRASVQQSFTVGREARAPRTVRAIRAQAARAPRRLRSTPRRSPHPPR